MYRLAFPVLLILAVAAPAEAKRAPDGTVTHVYDLSRGPSETLNLLHTTGHGVWQYGDDRRLGRLEKDALYSTALKYSDDPRSSGWMAQGYLSIRDLRAKPLQITVGTKGKYAERKIDETAPYFDAYVKSLPALYKAAGYKLMVPPSELRFQKHLRAGRKRIKVYYADLGARWIAPKNVTEDHHVNIYGFVVNDYLVTLRVHFVNGDKTSAFLDGLDLTIKKKLPKDTRNVKLTSVTPDHTESRILFATPKDFTRVNTAGPDDVIYGQMARFQRTGKRGAWNASLELTRRFTKFNKDRDFQAWLKEHEKLLGKAPKIHRKRPHGVDIRLVMAPAKIDGKDVTVCLLYFKLGSHRFTIRCEHLGTDKKAKALAIRECDTMLATFAAWQTRPQRSK